MKDLPITSALNGAGKTEIVPVCKRLFNGREEKPKLRQKLTKDVQTVKSIQYINHGYCTSISIKDTCIPVFLYMYSKALNKFYITERTNSS